MRHVFLGVLLLSPPLAAQDAAPPQGLARLDALVGKWRGVSSGEPGDGAVERECARVLAGRFLECRTTVTYPPQEKDKKGEVHVDVAYFSYDRSATVLRLRQFHGEGFVNTYRETEPLVFVTDAIENIPAGWRAREQYELDGDAWRETFSLAQPGKEFEVYSRASLMRVK
ncbi:MAG TPA: hypothetical protein VNA69_15790 [Thermoanaerobaculia bacterium]|nr:hypothetical protein [Thermoanaerobaculia bacterium]